MNAPSRVSNRHMPAVNSAGSTRTAYQGSPAAAPDPASTRATGLERVGLPRQRPVGRRNGPAGQDDPVLIQAQSGGEPVRARFGAPTVIAVPKAGASSVGATPARRYHPLRNTSPASAARLGLVAVTAF